MPGRKATTEDRGMDMEWTRRNRGQPLGILQVFRTVGVILLTEEAKISLSLSPGVVWVMLSSFDGVCGKALHGSIYAIPFDWLSFGHGLRHVGPK